MEKPPACPRCGGPVAAGPPPAAGARPGPRAQATGWRCGLHGEVYPLRPAGSPSGAELDAVAHDATVPVWLPWPVPVGWLVTGFAGAGDQRTGTRAVLVALTGPGPVGGTADMLLISEEPGIGLGARLAGLASPDPGEGFAAGPPHALVRFGHHEFPLWNVESPDRAAFAGEVLGNWLWLVLWPASAGVLLVEALSLLDLRDPGQDLDLPFGPRSAWLPG